MSEGAAGAAVRGKNSRRQAGPSDGPQCDNAGGQHVDDLSATAGAEVDIVTDPEGWVYAGNVWEGSNSRGGIGKYTRYRRWTCIARLTETVKTLVGPTDVGVISMCLGFGAKVEFPKTYDAILTASEGVICAPFGMPDDMGCISDCGC